MEANRKIPSRLSILFFPCLINDTGAAPDCRLPESQAQNKSDKQAGANREWSRKRRFFYQKSTLFK